MRMHKTASKRSENELDATGELSPAGKKCDHLPNRTKLDSILLLAFVVITGLLAIRFDALEALVEWSSAHEAYEVDEIFTILIVSSFALLVFTARRVVELRREMSLRRHAENNASRIAMYDSLTELPNRIMANQQLDKELARVSRNDEELAVLIISLDRFKSVIDVFGYETGDELVLVSARKLSGTVREMDTLARFGSDEFMIIQAGIDNRESALLLAARLLTCISSAPLDVNEHSICASISIGVALASDCNNDADELIRSAGIAMQRAKSEGGSSYRLFESDMQTKLRDRQLLERDLRHAIKTDGLNLNYQPLFDVNTKQLLGFEALLRWHDPVHGHVSPVDFIPVAEETGLIIGLGNWVLERACLDALQWAGEKKIAVNLSPVQFRDPELAEKVSEILQKTGLPAERLELEITEGVLIEDAESALNLLVELKALGVSISMDDFGTGYSSLSYLKLFPFDKIKIDRSFVSHLESDSEDAAIVRAILAMGHSLGMVATAEGVESEEQLTYLNDEGCDEAQGFHLGRPMTFDQALALSEAAYKATSSLPQVAANDFNHNQQASGE